MTTMDYIDIPPGATRLRSSSLSSTAKDIDEAASIRPFPTIHTFLPSPSQTSSDTSTTNTTKSRTSSMSISMSALTSPGLAFLPQILGVPSSPSTTTAPPGPPPQHASSSKSASSPATLLTKRDPLSLPLSTSNFKRFVPRSSPIFWTMDRVEEIVLWKRDWRLTCFWAGVWGFLCCYPRLTLLLPHVTLISIILSTYPYPPSPPPPAAYPTLPSITPLSPLSPSSSSFSSSSPTPSSFTSSSSSTNTNTNPIPPPPPPTSAPAPNPPPQPQEDPEQSALSKWQTNIQAIQNLMGAYADLHAFIAPHLSWVQLSPAHFSSPPFPPSSSTSSQAQPDPTPQASQYTPLLLTFLLLSLPPLAFTLLNPRFPVHLVFLLAGWAALGCGHPWVRGVGWPWVREVGAPRVCSSLSSWVASVASKYGLLRGVVLPISNAANVGSAAWLRSVIARFVDDDSLSDKCWRAEMREVEIWENERAVESPGLTTWSKAHLRPNERSAWTRGRDGWSAVGGGGAWGGSDASGGGGGEGEKDKEKGDKEKIPDRDRDSAGEVSSNLTFSLAPGWAFVETEGWRKDWGASWSAGTGGGDEDGWVYTNDAWMDPRPRYEGIGSGSVTRRRRWVRRVWFDEGREREQR